MTASWPSFINTCLFPNAVVVGYTFDRKPIFACIWNAGLEICDIFVCITFVHRFLWYNGLWFAFAIGYIEIFGICACYTFIAVWMFIGPICARHARPRFVMNMIFDAVAAITSIGVKACQCIIAFGAYCCCATRSIKTRHTQCFCGVICAIIGNLQVGLGTVIKISLVFWNLAILNFDFI